MIDGKFVEEWYMCCDAIPSARCTNPNVQPSWVNSYQFPSSVQKAPLVKGVEYPSWIFTPSNEQSTLGWNYNSYLRKRGVWSGEECFNEDLVEPIANVTNFDLRKMEKRTNQKEENGSNSNNQVQNKNNKDNLEESSSVMNSLSKIATIIIATLTFIFIYHL